MARPSASCRPSHPWRSVCCIVCACVSLTIVPSCHLSCRRTQPRAKVPVGKRDYDKTKAIEVIAALLQFRDDKGLLNETCLALLDLTRSDQNPVRMEAVFTHSCQRLQ